MRTSRTSARVAVTGVAPRSRANGRLRSEHDEPLDDPSDLVGAPSAHLLDALRSVSRELRVAERTAEQSLGLYPAQVHALRQLADRPAKSLAELAERTHTDPSSVSVVVQRLVDRGLVTRTAAADDRRRTELAATTAGRALLRRMPESAAQRVARALEAIGPRDGAQLVRTLAALAHELRDA